MLTLPRRALEIYRNHGLKTLLWRTRGFIELQLLPIHNLSKQEIHYKYQSEQSAQSYTTESDYSATIFHLIRSNAEKDLRDLSVLELGCNAGRHLVYLSEHGIGGLHGIEISPIAFDTFEETFPDVFAETTVSLGPAQKNISNYADGQIDVVYSCAALMHMIGMKEELFDEMARVSGDLIVLLEVGPLDRIPMSVLPEEKREGYGYARGTRKVQPRDYVDIFESRGFRLVERIDAWDDSDHSDRLKSFSAIQTGVATAFAFKKDT